MAIGRDASPWGRGGPIDAVERGDPVTGMRGDAVVVAPRLDVFAGLATETKGDTIPMGPDRIEMTLRQPVGVVARILFANALVGRAIADPYIHGAALARALGAVVLGPAETAAEVLGPLAKAVAAARSGAEVIGDVRVASGYTEEMSEGTAEP